MNILTILNKKLSCTHSQHDDLYQREVCDKFHMSKVSVYNLIKSMSKGTLLMELLINLVKTYVRTTLSHSDDQNQDSFKGSLQNKFSMSNGIDITPDKPTDCPTDKVIPEYPQQIGMIQRFVSSSIISYIS